MKKIFIVSAFYLLLFLVSCGGEKAESKQGSLYETCYPNGTCNQGLICDTENNVCVKDPGNPINDSDKTDSGSNEKPDTGSDSDSGDSAPDNGDTTSDEAPNNDDTTPDNGNSQPDNDPSTPNDNPDNLPECSPTSTTPCIDSEALGADSEKAYLIWSGKSPERLRWIDAIDYCKNLKEGGYSDWQLPTMVALETLLRCTIQPYTGSCNSENSDGENSKFGDIAFFWSTTRGQGIDFYTGKIHDTKSETETFDVRCVRKERTSREVECTAIPENSEYNTVSNITQTWDWTALFWFPNNETTYNEKTSTTNCHFKCASSYYIWDGATCTTIPECSALSGTPCYDSTTHLTWSAISPIDMTWEGALSYCNTNLGWRLPNINELRTLILNCSGSVTGGNCAIKDPECLSLNCWSQDYCGSCSPDDIDIINSKLGDGQDIGLWSSSVCPDCGQKSPQGWYVSFYSGNIFYEDFFRISSMKFKVRCIK